MVVNNKNDLLEVEKIYLEDKENHVPWIQDFFYHLDKGKKDLYKVEKGIKLDVVVLHNRKKENIKNVKEDNRLYLVEVIIVRIVNVLNIEESYEKI